MSEQSELNRKKKIMTGVGYAALVIAIYYVIFKYLIYIAWPFVIAVLVVLATRRPVLFLARKLHMPEKGAAFIVVTLVYLLIAGILVFVVLKAFWAIVNWSGNLPTIYNDSVEPVIEKLFAWIREHSVQEENNIDYLAQLGATILDKLESAIGWISTKAISLGKTLAVGIPKTMLGILFMVISTFFLALDYGKIVPFFMAQFTPNQQQIIISSREHVGSGIANIVVSYGIIMGITFIELNIALRIIHVESPTTIALLIAIFDILPALGCGGVMIPWTIIEFINGNVKLGIGLLISYVIITIIRNIIEPKIVGEHIGVHPVLMLMSIYLGAIILGPFGIIILPFTLIVIKRLNDSGLIHVFNSVKKEE